MLYPILAVTCIHLVLFFLMNGAQWLSVSVHCSLLPVLIGAPFERKRQVGLAIPPSFPLIPGTTCHSGSGADFLSRIFPQPSPLSAAYGWQEYKKVISVITQPDWLIYFLISEDVGNVCAMVFLLCIQVTLGKNVFFLNSVLDGSTWTN